MSPTIARTLTKRSSKQLMRSWAGALRCLAVVVATLCLFAQFSILSHMLLVRHVACPEHGELIHAEDAAAHAARELDAHVQRASSSALVSESEASASHGHDHCFLISERREGLAVAPFSACLSAPAPSATRTEARAPHEPGRGSSRALYLLAPKNSPPA